MHETDHDDRPYVLAHVDLPNVALVGWLIGREAKQQKWWKDPQRTNRHAFFIPSQELRPIAELVPEDFFVSVEDRKQTA